MISRQEVLQKAGFVRGAVVEQDNGALAGVSRAVVHCVHDNGALDVEINGKRYGWSALFCKPTGEHVELSDQIKQEQEDAAFARRVAAYLFVAFAGLAVVSLAMTWAAY